MHLAIFLAGCVTGALLLVGIAVLFGIALWRSEKDYM